MRKPLKFLVYKGFPIIVSKSAFPILSIISLLLTAVFLLVIVQLQMSYFLVLLLPAYFSNMFAYWSSKIKFLKPLGKPVDLNLKWLDGSRLLGDSKTFRGILSGAALAIFVAYVTYVLSLNFGYKVYSSLEEALFFGFVAGAGALLGDLVRSFLKRRLNMLTGENWLLFDDLDFVVGSLLLLNIYIKFPLNFVVLVLIGTIPLRLLTHIIDFKLKAKKVY